MRLLLALTIATASHTVPHILPPAAQKAIYTGFFKGHCTVKSKSPKGQRKDRERLWNNCKVRIAVTHLPKHLLDVHFGRD